MINLSRALKEKRRLIGRINEYENEVRIHNVYEKANKEVNTKENKVDILGVYEDLKMSINKLFELKSKISKANAESGINELVYEMEEMKNFLNFLSRVPDTEDSHWVNIGDDKRVLFEKGAQLNREFLKEEKNNIKKRIEELQDLIDEKNAMIKIDYEP